jgi:PASTA domain
MHTPNYWGWPRVGLTGLLVSALSALLLVASGPAWGMGSILYDQNNMTSMSEVGTWSTVSRNAEATDDFVVPAATSWQIGTIKTTGLDIGLTSVRVTIYTDSSRLPGTQVYARTLSSGSFTEEPGPYPWWPGGNLTIPVNVTLPSGHYWLSVQGDAPNDQPYFWQARNVVANQAAMYRGPSCTSWGDLANCMFPGYQAGSLDLMFALYGPDIGLTPPSVRTGSVEVGPTTATLTGTVNPNGFSVTGCHFAYGPGVGNALPNNVACDVLPGSGTSDVTVSATLRGLSPDTVYSYTLNAANPTGNVESGVAVFTTAAQPSHRVCVVPNAKGKTLPAARKAIRKAHCSVGKITKVKAAKRSKGHVLSQSPKPGKHLREASKVALRVGK